MSDEAFETVEITLRGVDPSEDVVEFVRGRARAVADDIGPPRKWVVRLEATWPRGVRVYECTVAYVGGEHSVDARCANLDLYDTVARAFQAVRRSLVERHDDARQRDAHVVVRPGRRGDESSRTYRL